MKFLTEKKILYLKQLALGRIFPLPMQLFDSAESASLQKYYTL